MNPDDIRSMADDPDLIPGIYNYCDRWCERCPFTSRCLNFKFGEAHFDGESRDPENAKFWEQLSAVWQVTAQMIYEEAEELGIDLTVDPDDLAQIEREEAARDLFVHMHPLVRSAEKYVDAASAWFDSAESEDDGVVDLSFGNMISVRDAISVIRWYQFQIQVKLMRALRSRDDDREWGEQSGDANGSAKVALIGIQRSAAAWIVLRNCLPMLEASTIARWRQLIALQQQVEAEFPTAWTFKRPGFDD
jgi:hypothetical protein